jgi:hypothetical protein
LSLPPSAAANDSAPGLTRSRFIIKIFPQMSTTTL